MQLAKPLIINILEILNPKSVLDLGCGSCKFSQKFIEQGISVTGVDKEKTKQSKNNFKFIQKDILDFEFNEAYGLIIGTGILHFLKKEEAIKLIKKMQENTLAGGFHFLICMSNKESSNSEFFYPSEEELNSLYSGWRVIHNTLCLSKKHGETNHQHKVIVFLAKKI